MSIHPDCRVQAVLEQRREAESLQAIDRLRLIHNTDKKYVWILCSIPLDLPVDSLVTWQGLRGAAFKLWAVLKKCDTNGRNAVSLAAKELSGNFPDLWETTRKASKWLDKKPLDPCIGFIRDWGFLAEYRPQGQRSWSRAIVRHGTTDHGAAIESALSLPTDSVVMRLVEQPH